MKNNSFIHSFKNFWGAPSRNLLRGAQSTTTVIQSNLKQPVEHTFIIVDVNVKIYDRSSLYLLKWLTSF